MAEIMEGNAAIGWAAYDAGCEAYCSYPITPQNEVVEWFAREYPKRGRIFRQSTSELESTFLSMGFAIAGAKTMTSTASPGWGLYPEGMSHIVAAELPLVVGLMVRGGPGQGTTRHAQMDYTSATRPGGAGGYKNIVLAPWSSQECYDMVRLAFDLAEKYHSPVMFLSEPNITRVIERVTREAPKSPATSTIEREHALKGKASHKDGKARLCTSGPGVTPTSTYPDYYSFLLHLKEKFKSMEENEVRYEQYGVADAEIVVVAYGYTARVSWQAMQMARAEGIKVGLIRPISLWPFPVEPIRTKAAEKPQFLVVEDNLGDIGGLVDDVRYAVAGMAEIHQVTALDRHETGENGAIFPQKVLEKIKKIKGGIKNELNSVSFVS